MTRGRGGACVVRSAAVRGQRLEVTSCLRRCRDTCSSPASLWPPSSRPGRRSCSLRSASPSVCGTTAAGSLRTPGLQGEIALVMAGAQRRSHKSSEAELHLAGRQWRPCSKSTWCFAFESCVFFKIVTLGCQFSALMRLIHYTSSENVQKMNPIHCEWSGAARLIMMVNFNFMI